MDVIIRKKIDNDIEFLRGLGEGELDKGKRGEGEVEQGKCERGKSDRGKGKGKDALIPVVDKACRMGRF